MTSEVGAEPGAGGDVKEGPKEHEDEGHQRDASTFCLARC